MWNKERVYNMEDSTKNFLEVYKNVLEKNLKKKKEKKNKKEKKMYESQIQVTEKYKIVQSDHQQCIPIYIYLQAHEDCKYAEEGVPIGTVAVHTTSMTNKILCKPQVWFSFEVKKSWDSTRGAYVLFVTRPILDEPCYMSVVFSTHLATCPCSNKEIRTTLQELLHCEDIVNMVVEYTKHPYGYMLTGSNKIQCEGVTLCAVHVCEKREKKTKFQRPYF